MAEIEYYKLQVGKHKGKHYEEVDMDYLMWYLYNVKDINRKLKDKLESHLFDNYLLKFGKYKGDPIGVVHIHGGNYLEWLYDKVTDANLKKFIGSIYGKESN